MTKTLAHKLASVAVVAALGVSAVRATEPNADTRRWWAHVQALAGDDMRGRYTGSPEHRPAQEYVARHLEAAGVAPAGEQGYFQTVPLKAYRLQLDRSTATLVRDGRSRPLRWLEHIAVAPARGLPASIAGTLVFAGSDNAVGLSLSGTIVVRLNPVRLVEGPAQPAPPAGATAVIGIDSALGPEPQRWPSQRGLTVTQADATLPALQGMPVLRFNPAFADLLLEGSGHTYRELLQLAAEGRAVPSFVIPASISVAPVFEESALRSDNVIGVLRGSDPALAPQHVVVNAHIDGYGLGMPWGADNIYNGAFDDAAYVATLLEFADRLRESGTRLRRSVLFASFTGEELGLLGARYFTSHLTVPRAQVVADVNLDQIRPLFALRTLTMHNMDDSTLGDLAREVAASMGITLQRDPEPLRNMARRVDSLAFLQIGVPATSFIFGYTPGSPEEAAVREWYKERYHTPKDDVTQPWVPEAAARFNEFFARFVTAIANENEAPRWKPESEFAPRGQR